MQRRAMSGGGGGIELRTVTVRGARPGRDRSDYAEDSRASEIAIVGELVWKTYLPIIVFERCRSPLRMCTKRCLFRERRKITKSPSQTRLPYCLLSRRVSRSKTGFVATNTRYSAILLLILKT